MSNPLHGCKWLSWGSRITVQCWLVVDEHNMRTTSSTPSPEVKRYFLKAYPSAFRPRHVTVLRDSEKLKIFWGKRNTVSFSSSFSSFILSGPFENTQNIITNICSSSFSFFVWLISTKRDADYFAFMWGCVQQFLTHREEAVWFDLLLLEWNFLYGGKPIYTKNVNWYFQLSLERGRKINVEVHFSASNCKICIQE